MALADTTGAAFASANATSVTSASFTPAAGDLLVAVVSVGNGAGNITTETHSVTDSLSGTWTLLKYLTDNFGNGSAGVYCRDVASATSMTVTFTSSRTDVGLAVRRFSGAKPAASQTGATAQSVATPYTVTITPTVTGSALVGAIGRATSNVTLTANGVTTIYGQANGGAGDTLGAFKATALTASLTAQTIGFTNAASANNNIVAVEILPAVPASLDGPAVSASSSAGDLARLIPAAGTAASASAAAGDLDWQQHPSGTAASPSVAAGDFAWTASLASGAVSASVTNDGLEQTRAMAGTAASASSAAGDVVAFTPVANLAALVSAQAVTSGAAASSLSLPAQPGVSAGDLIIIYVAAASG